MALSGADTMIAGEGDNARYYQAGGIHKVRCAYRNRNNPRNRNNNRGFRLASTSTPGPFGPTSAIPVVHGRPVETKERFRILSRSVCPAERPNTPDACAFQ